MSDELHDEQRPSRLTRRHLIKASIAGSLSAPVLFGGLAADATANLDQVTVSPVYYPLATPPANPIDLTGKLAVVTGASRGNGRAIAEALAAQGVDVVGTSRNPAQVPNPPAFPLVSLDVADPASVGTFPARLQATAAFRRRRRVDILANNAGRFVFGEIIPLSAGNAAFYASQRDLAVRTLYAGHVMMTNTVLPLMSQTDYSRIMFTVSVASYYMGSTISGLSLLDAYNAGKAALRTYANNLGKALADAHSSIRVSTVNPYTMHTALAEHPNPIYTQPVNANGLSATGDTTFDTVVGTVRQILRGGLDPQMVGSTYVQLLQASDPVPNVVVASPALAGSGQNDLIHGQILGENRLSAIPLDTV